MELTFSMDERTKEEKGNQEVHRQILNHKWKKMAVLSLKTSICER